MRTPKDPEMFKRSADFYVRGIKTDLPIYGIKEFKFLAKSRIKTIMRQEKNKLRKEEEHKKFIEDLIKYGI